MYIHKVQYYETDKMGIVHHSNYIRWMEEARVDYLEKINLSYDRLEEEGIGSFVLSVECAYKKPAHFGEMVEIDARIEELKGVRMTIGYAMQNEAGDTISEGKSVHCFTNAGGKPISLKKDRKDIYDTLIQSMEEEVK